MAIHINIDNKVFLPCYRPYVEDYSNRYNVLYGGRGSGKTIFAFEKLLIKGLKEKRTILLMRKTTANCKFSVWKELKEAVDRFKLNKFFTFYESDYSAICKLNGTVFKCTGLDDAEKIKGFSEISDVLLEEATEFTPEDFELIDGTVRSVKYSIPLQIYLLFNPVSKANWVYKRFGFDTAILEKIRNYDKDIELWYLTHEINEKVIRLATVNDYAIAFNCKKYVAEMLKKAQDKNIKLASWTVDNPKIYKELYDLGVRNFTTNRLTK